MATPPQAPEEPTSRVRLGLLVLALLGAAGLFVHKLGRTIVYSLRHHEPTVVPFEGAPVLPVVKHAHVPGSMQETRETIVVDGVTRSYVLLVPRTPRDRTDKLPLVMVFHGDGGTDEGFHNGFPFETASGEDAIVVYPNGRSATWELHEDATANTDIHFVDALKSELAKRLGIDTERTFGAAYSSGGFFINLVACEKPGFFRAIASSAGGAPHGRSETFANGFTKCKGQLPIATLTLHGTHDFGVGIDSGAFAAQYWAYVNGCSTSEMETTGYPECHAYRTCPKDKPSVFCKVDGLGHWVWERAAEASWTFFQRS